MGQVQQQGSRDILLTAVDRLVASNAAGGLSPAASHVIAFGENAASNNTQSNIIAIGAFAADGGIADADLAGTIAIGVNAASALNNSTGSFLGTPGSVVIGHNAAALAPNFVSMVVIGGGALGNYNNAGVNPPTRSVIIGNQAAGNWQSNTSSDFNIIIGYRCYEGGAIGAQPGNVNVMIGANIATNSVVAVSDNVFIGQGACQTVGQVGTPTQNVVVGNSAGQNLRDGLNNTMIGAASDVGISLTVAEQSNNVVLGQSARAAGSQNVVLGAGARQTAGVTAFGNILIGYQCGVGTTVAGASNYLLIETNNAENVAGPKRTILYGELSSGSIAVGNSTNGTDRDLPGTNVLKVINGTATANPNGGAMFYATAGNFLWRSSAGIDYQLTTMSRGAFTVAGLAGLVGLIAGQRAYATDAAAPAFGAAVAGGGAVFTPVFYNGAAWIVG